MTAHDLATGTSWAVIDRPYNSDASRLSLSSGDLNVFSSNQIGAAGVYVMTCHGEISTTVNFQVRHPY